MFTIRKVNKSCPKSLEFIKMEPRSQILEFLKVNFKHQYLENFPISSQFSWIFLLSFNKTWCLLSEKLIKAALTLNMALQFKKLTPKVKIFEFFGSFKHQYLEIFPISSQFSWIFLIDSIKTWYFLPEKSIKAVPSHKMQSEFKNLSKNSVY